VTHVVSDDGRTLTPDVRRTSLPSLGATFNDVRRQLATRLQGTAPVTSALPLELLARGVQDAPSLRDVEVLDAGGMRAHDIGGHAESSRFAAFLDGAQWSLALWAGGVPVVHGTVAAVIRKRDDRRMTTWRRPIVRRALYAPLALLSADWRHALEGLDLDVVDTLARRTPESAHPFELQEIAYQAVLGARETIERTLAEDWCDDSDRELFMDGGIAGSKRVAGSPNVVGVVKSHQRLYASPAHLDLLMQLKQGERSSVVRAAESKRAPVASWYLRLRDATGRDPFWGLVRVEVALGDTHNADALQRRADEVSRWILAEALPLAVPDARWDKMVYGIRDCEEFLRAIQ
jgi:hypothetical protein